MSKSLARVKAALAEVEAQIYEMPSETRTALQAAEAVGCALDQIVKSILFQGTSGRLFLFLAAGGNQVDAAKASALAGEALGRADADTVRRLTGFAIGGVSPVGHLTPHPLWLDRRLTEFGRIYAAAGTPRHLFSIAPAALLAASGAEIADFTA